MISNSEFLDPGRPVLVIGGRGFVGSHVVRALLSAGLSVHVYGPPMAIDLLADCRGCFAETAGTVEDAAAIAAALAGSGAGALITAAAHSGGDQGLMRGGEAEADRAMAVNVGGLRRTLEAARAAGLRRVVWLGSTVVYGAASRYGKVPVDESDPRHPETVYGLTKVLGEDIAQYYRDRYGMDVIGLRVPLLLGRDLWYQGAAAAIAAVMRAASSGAMHRVRFHDQPIDLMHVADAARAVLLALACPRRLQAIYNVNGFTATMGEIVRSTVEAVPGYRVEHEIQPAPFVFPLVSDQRFREDAGYAPVHSLASVIAELAGTGGRA